MGTQIKSGSPQANRLQNGALFTEACKAKTWVNLLTGPAPQKIKGESGKTQTHRGAPIVRVTDLEKAAGDEVTVDIFHKLQGLPTMGDRKLEGRGESMSAASHDVKINQGRHMVDSGGKMTQKRTKHNLRQVSRQLLANDQGYMGRLKDEIAQVHIMGARGDFANEDTILPFDTHEEFAEIMVNPVTPPTYNRHMYGGDATSLDSIDAADIFTLDCVANAKLYLEEAGNPLMPIALPGDELAMHDPLYVHWVTPRQWADLQDSTSMKDWNKMAADALRRSSGFAHMLFKGEMAMKDNILIKKMSRTTRFSTGRPVNVCTNTKTAQTTQVAPNVTVERSVIMGAQALAHAYGMAGKKEKGGYHFHVTEEPADHGNSHETVVWWMDGMSKIRFKNKHGYMTDHGILVVDTAVNGL